MFNDIFKPVELINKSNRDIMIDVSPISDVKNARKASDIDLKMKANKYISEISEAASHQEKDGNNSSMIQFKSSDNIKPALY